MINFPDENFYYPLFVQKPWLAGNTLRASLDHGVKQVRKIQLVGYSLQNKRQIGLQSAHDVSEDDYLILKINEINGQVLSNNRFANGSFAVLHSGSTSDNEVGAIEYNRFGSHINPIAEQHVDSMDSTIRNLTLEIVDRKGEAAHFGRMHLWFKLLVTHG